MRYTQGDLIIEQPFVLITPCFAMNDGKGAVPPQVIRFLNTEQNRKLMTGVIGCGNKNFGRFYAAAADVVAAKCGVPVLRKIELRGLPSDVEAIRAIMNGQQQ